MVTSDISPRTTAYADRRLLKRAKFNNILGQWGQVRTLPGKKGLVIKFRRYNKLAKATTPLTEGVTPAGKVLTKTDLTATLAQYGDWVGISDVIMDTHEDPVLGESVDVLGEQAAETIDTLRAGVLQAGTNVMYAAGAVNRAGVLNVPTRDDFRTLIRILKAQHAKPITSVNVAGPNISTVGIPKSYVLACHSDAQPDFERLADWLPVQKYPSQKGIMEGEIGSIGEIRVVTDNNLVPWADAGGTAATNGVLSTTGTQADVYPMLVFGRDSYGIVPLGGKGSVHTLVSNPKAQDGDPLAQRGSVGWKAYNATAILNDLWMIRLETALKG